MRDQDLRVIFAASTKLLVLWLFLGLFFCHNVMQSISTSYAQNSSSGQVVRLVGCNVPCDTILEALLLLCKVHTLLPNSVWRRARLRGRGVGLLEENLYRLGAECKAVLTVSVPNASAANFSTYTEAMLLFWDVL